MLSNYPFRSFEFWPCEEAGQWHRQEPELHLFHISVLNVVCTLHELNAWASLLSTVSPAPEPVCMVSITWSGLLPLAALQRTKWPLGCITRHIHARTHTHIPYPYPGPPPPTWHVHPPGHRTHTHRHIHTNTGTREQHHKLLNSLYKCIICVLYHA